MKLGFILSQHLCSEEMLQMLQSAAEKKNVPTLILTVKYNFTLSIFCILFHSQQLQKNTNPLQFIQTPSSNTQSPPAPQMTGAHEGRC